MSDKVTAQGPINAREAPPRLKEGVVGPLGLAALVIGVTSPAIGLFATWGPIEASAGPIAPLVFLGALAIILPTVVSYAALNRHAPSAGMVATWLWTTVGPLGGLTAGLVTITYFTMAATTVPLLFGLFFNDLLARAHAPLTGIAAVMVGLVLHSILVAWISLKGAKASVVTTVWLMAAETTVVLALSATIIVVRAQAGGLNLSPLDPSSATHGLSGFWAAILLGILAFSGFDVVAATAEEAQAPREQVPRVLAAAVIGIALFWAANAWVLSLSTPPDKVAEYNNEGLTAITQVAHAYWGWGDLAVIATAFTGLTAIYISCVQGASRVLFALARHGLLPVPLARLGGLGRTPRVAVLCVVAICVTAGAASLMLLRNGLDSFVWWSNAMVFFAALTFTGVNIANLLYFRRVAPGSFRIGPNFVAPIVGAILSLYLLYAAFFSALWSAPFRTGRSVVLFCLGLLALEVAAAVALRRSRRDLVMSSPPIGVGAIEAALPVQTT
jgi:amino acid transporter